MDLKVLKAFLTVCKTGNITKAAEEIYVSQPALSRQIQDLEEELGCKLLNRHTRSLSLTESGYLFQLRAQEILELSAQAKRELSQQGELGGTIVLGVVESSVMEYLSKKIKKFREKHPRIRFHIHSAAGDELRRKIDSDKLDLAVLIEPVEIAKYKSVPLETKERWGLVVREDSVEEERLAFSKKEAASLELILPSRDIVIEEICEWLGVSEKDLKIVALHNLLSNATAMVQNGLGSSLCIEGSFTNRGCPGLRFVPIEPEMISGHVLIRKKNKSLSKIAEQFWEFLEEETKKEHEVEV